MDKLRFKAIAALIFGLLCTHAAWAQTAANLTVISGNGQIICQVCSFPTFFQPMIVRVTDATGQPVANKTVNWTLLPSATPGVAPFFFDTTVTDGNGVTVNPINQTSQTGSIAYPFLQSNVQASADGINTVFTVTQALSTASDRQTPLVFVRLDSPAVGSNIQGTAGGTSTTQVKVHVDSFGTPVVRASLRVFITTDPATTASVACATGAGADIGSVLTDANGDAVCNLVFGPISGNNEFTILVGGVDPAAAPNYILAQQPIGYRQFSHFQISVRAGVPGMLTPTNGNNQNVNPGQPTSPFVVKVTDASGLNPVGGQAVTWSVSPVGAVTFNPPVSTSDALGSASTVGTLSSSAVGAITVRATLGSLTTTFNLNANVTLTGLQKVSGDSQTAPASQPFGQPLVVQVNGSTGQPVANFPVNFTVSGPATLSAASATTNASGRAQINVTAGATQGNVTVTATAGSFTQTFSHRNPAGPVLTTGGFLNGADFQQGALSPCGVATIKGAGIASTVQGVVVPGNIV